MKYMSSVADAQKEFKKKFSDKTKNSWDKRHNFTPVPGKYTLLEMDDDSEDEEVCTTATTVSETKLGISDFSRRLLVSLLPWRRLMPLRQ